MTSNYFMLIQITDRVDASNLNLINTLLMITIMAWSFNYETRYLFSNLFQCYFSFSCYSFIDSMAL